MQQTIEPLSESLFQKRLKELEITQKNLIEKYGFYAHYLQNNYHTHGLEETYSHLNFQIVLPNLSIEEAHDIFWEFVKQVKNGFVFETNTMVENVIENTTVKLLKTREEGRTVLRIILPDENGWFPHNDECSFPFNQQENSRFAE